MKNELVSEKGTSSFSFKSDIIKKHNRVLQGVIGRGRSFGLFDHIFTIRFIILFRK